VLDLKLFDRVILRTIVALFVCAACPLHAGQLAISIGPPRSLDTAALLARRDVETITVPLDPSYGHAMTYRAVRLRDLLAVTALPVAEVVQLVAADGFVADIPAALIIPRARNGAVPWLAIETPGKPWPHTPQGNATGPFYLVWVDPAASGILREQWTFAVVKLQLAPPAEVRWPQLKLGGNLPAGSPVRLGQMLAASQCMVCHQINGAGDAAIGPDLNRPRKPTDHLGEAAFRAFVRHPASLPDTAARRMPGFAKTILSDRQVDAIYVYLRYVAHQRN
jgi:mono/diheme cytochrome c family protein